MILAHRPSLSRELTKRNYLHQFCSGTFELFCMEDKMSICTLWRTDMQPYMVEILIT